tara:strand:+ start:157 stop:408 length:252 start_codon:yes stop_codon:yes gene_type:complete
MVKKPSYPYELIGEKIRIIEAKNKYNHKINGIIIDETKFTLKIEIQGKIKTLFKNSIVFKIERTGVVINGKEIVKRPEDRIKG